VFKGGAFPPGSASGTAAAPSNIPPPPPAPPIGGAPPLPRPIHTQASPIDGIIFEEFERKTVADPAAALQNYIRKNKQKAIEDLKATGQETSSQNISDKLALQFNALSEEEKKQYQPFSNKRVRVQKGTVFGSEKFEPRKLQQQSGTLIKSIDKLYSMGVAVTMAMAAKDGKTYKYFPEEMANEREVMKSLDQHLLQLQYALWDEKDLGGMIFRSQNAKERTPNSKVTCKKSLAEVIRPRLENILGGAISWKKLQTGATKLLGWPLKDRNGKDRFPNRFFDLKISEMKSILNVIDGVAMIDHDRDGRHVIGVVQGHIDRIVRTYDDKHKENKELQNYLVRLRAALSVAAGDIGTPSGLTPVGLPNIPTPNISTASIQSASIPTASTIPNGNIPSPSNPPPSNMPPNSLTAAGSLPTQATTMPTVTPPSALPSSTGTVPQTATTPAIASPNQSTPQRV